MNWEIVVGLTLGLLAVVGMFVVPFFALVGLSIAEEWFENHVPGGEITFWVVLFLSLILGGGLVIG